MVDLDWEYSDDDCPKCGEQMAYRDCYECEDGVWEFTDCNGTEYVRCDSCGGNSYYEWCRECGWDNVFNCFLSEQYEKEFYEKQSKAPQEVSKSLS
jgi:hypothetical protein